MRLELPALGRRSLRRRAVRQQEGVQTRARWEWTQIRREPLWKTAAAVHRTASGWATVRSPKPTRGRRRVSGRTLTCGHLRRHLRRRRIRHSSQRRQKCRRTPTENRRHLRPNRLRVFGSAHPQCLHIGLRGHRRRHPCRGGTRGGTHRTTRPSHLRSPSPPRRSKAPRPCLSMRRSCTALLPVVEAPWPSLGSAPSSSATASRGAATEAASAMISRCPLTRSPVPPPLANKVGVGHVTRYQVASVM